MRVGPIRGGKPPIIMAPPKTVAPQPMTKKANIKRTRFLLTHLERDRSMH
jgi:hypothetical protein